VWGDHGIDWDNRDSIERGIEERSRKDSEALTRIKSTVMQRRSVRMRNF
jgi:hypothetical protein